MNKPTWDADGQPVNFEATASDALLYLRTFQAALVVSGYAEWPRNKDLDRLTTMLGKFFLEVPNDQPQR